MMFFASHLRTTWAGAAGALVALAGVVAAARADDDAPTASDAAFRAMNQAPLLFVGEVTKSELGGAVGLSDPPLYSVTVEFADMPRVLRGRRPAAWRFRQSVRSRTPPSYAVGKTYVVAAEAPEGPRAPGNIRFIALADAKQEALALSAAKLPLGWRLRGDEPLSPWAGGDWKWPAKSALAADARCVETGRPALLAGSALELSVEQVPPKVKHEFRNPFGDGEFRVTLKNTSAEAVSVPALPRVGDKILWREALVAMQNGQARVAPPLATAEELAAAEPLKLAAGEQVSTTFDTLLLPDIHWPRGGSRVYFTFALGELAAVNFFYYYSDHHDRLREARAREARP